MKKVIIVGAGIAGLTAAIYACKSGFNVKIYESHSIPGGACTSWRRKGYLFEGGLHWLTGSSPDNPLNKLWREVGALDDDIAIYNRDPFFSVEYKGQTAHLYRDIDKLRSHLLEISPEDEREINGFCRDVEKFIKIVNMSMEKILTPPSTVFGIFPALFRMPFYGNQTAKEYSERFKSPILQRLLQNIVGTENSAIAMIFTFATLASGDGGYPEGGSLAMTGRMAKYFEALGGTIEYGRKIDKVWVRDGIAQGVVAGGDCIEADAVIVTQDTLAAVDKLFDSPINEPWAQRMRQVTKPILNTFVCLGVEADLSDLPGGINLIIEEPVFCADVPLHCIDLNNYAGYKGYAPEGCTAVTSIISGDSYAYWKACKANGTYESEKQKLAEALIRILADKYPQTAGKIAVWDVATPLTYERYLGSYKGSWMSIMGKGQKMANYPSKPKTIQNLYFAGQRLMGPGGLPVAAQTGKKAAQCLCKDKGIAFNLMHKKSPTLSKA